MEKTKTNIIDERIDFEKDVLKLLNKWNFNTEQLFRVKLDIVAGELPILTLSYGYKTPLIISIKDWFLRLKYKIINSVKKQ